MGKFNVVQKQRRRAIAEQKRAKHGDPITNKLSQKNNPNHPLHSISGKRKRKLFKKWRRDQKEAVEKGVITMQDVEMAVADDDDDDGTSQVATKQRPPLIKKFPIKRTTKLKARHFIIRDKKKKKEKKIRKADDGVAEASSTSAMEE